MREKQQLWNCLSGETLHFNEKTLAVAALVKTNCIDCFTATVSHSVICLGEIQVWRLI